MDLSKKERNAIASLKRLANRWPDTLWLFSASGTLCVMKSGSNREQMKNTKGSIDPEYEVATIDIPNDGGDW